MRSAYRLLQLLLQLLYCLGLVQGHGRLVEPPGRSSMWRFGYKTPINYNDNQLFCGGVGIQYSKEVGGKCGVCGDPWNGPRENEAGGIYATGLIVRKYQMGQVIDVTVDLTANHKGYFEFRLCQKDNPKEKATWDCLNKNLLVVEDTGLTRFPIKYISYSSKFTVKLRLPANLKCKACVLQWKYNAGNSWGYDEKGRGCIGCGNQEQFYGCSDIAIGYANARVAGESEKACDYKEIEDYQWQWDCTGKAAAEQFSRNPPSRARVGHYPLIPLYILSFILLVLHNMLFRR